MRGFMKSGLIVILILSSVSCVKDSSNTEHCWKKIRIEPKWIDISPKNNESTVNIIVTSEEDRNEVYRFTSDIYGIDVDIPAGSYEFIGWEDADNVTVDKRIVSVGTHTNGTTLEAGIFSGGTTVDEVHFNQAFQIIPLPMRQQTRELYLLVNFTGNGLSLINEVTGTLTGIALSRDIDNGFPPVDGERHPEAIRSGKVAFNLRSNNNGWFSDGHRLIGIDGENMQELDIRVFFNDSFSNISLDVTDALNDFHTVNVHEPMYIVLELNIGVNFEMEIIDWASGSESWLTAQ